MPWFRLLLWIGTISMMVVLLMKSTHLRSKGVPTVEVFEMADKDEAAEILQLWKDANALHTVKSSIKLDYLFIVLYVLLMINCSNHQMNLERNLLLNNFLRLSIPLSVDTGILDLAENLIMQHNIRSIEDHLPTALIATLKFAFAGWIILVWVVSVAKRAATSRSYA